MVGRYAAVWPSHPFTFRVPYQQRPLRGARVDARRTAAAIRATVLELIHDLHDEAWVYWCIDDKYPLELVEPPVEQIAEAVLPDRLPGIDGILFCRARRMLLPEYLLDERRAGPAGLRLLRRRDYSQIWIHQFLRVKVLRHLFQQFPESIPEPAAMDFLKEEVALPPDHRLYVVERNLAVFGESTAGGRVTSNCAASLRAQGLGVPEGFDELDAEPVIIGEIAEARQAHG